VKFLYSITNCNNRNFFKEELSLMKNVNLPSLYVLCYFLPDEAEACSRL
jgi:hypothetical protein